MAESKTDAPNMRSCKGNPVALSIHLPQSNVPLRQTYHALVLAKTEAAGAKKHYASEKCLLVSKFSKYICFE